MSLRKSIINLIKNINWLAKHQQNPTRQVQDSVVGQKLLMECYRKERDSTLQKFRDVGFDGIKDLILLGRTDDFVNRFRNSGKQQAYTQATNATIGLVPRYFMELFAFSALIILILVLMKNNGGNLSIVLPILGIYALAAFKVLPAMQQVYANFSSLKCNIIAFENIRDDLVSARNATCCLQDTNIQKLELKKSIKLENIDFTHPNKETPALKNLKFEIFVNQVIGIIGSSGAGKSTAIDVLLGLITPDSGNLKIDDTIITNTNLRAWQNTIGFVPQSIFLSEGTIAENIAFGIPRQQINIDQANKALSLAHRFKTVQKCDEIFIIDQGKVIGKGSYEELLVTNTQFKKMSNYS